MAHSVCVDSFLLLLYLVCALVTYVSSYQEFTITHPKVCSLVEKKGKIKLTESSDAAIVEETRSFDKWPGLKFHCRFEVKDVRGDNDRVVFAVIQNLKFRKAPNGACIDYVQFKDEEKSVKFCGEMGPLLFNSVNDDEGALAPYAFIGSEEVEVTIYVAAEKLLPEESLDIKIAFTSARKCYDPRGRNRHLSTIPCGDNTYCISSVYANDSIFNCPYVFCKDEGGCKSHDTVSSYHRPSVGTKMTIGAITTVLATFLVFFACIWVLRHYRKLCWSSEFSGQREVRMTPVPPVPTGPDSLEAGTIGQDDVHSIAPSAPPLDNRVSTILNDKDLPPPYESLFPASSR